MPGPLDGVRILEFTQIIAGPYGGMLLSDMGADVIKVEPPWGEPWRFAQEFVPNESRNFISLNRGKRSLPLDLTKPEGLEIVYRLIPDRWTLSSSTHGPTSLTIWESTTKLSRRETPG